MPALTCDPRTARRPHAANAAAWRPRLDADVLRQVREDRVHPARSGVICLRSVLHRRSCAGVTGAQHKCHRACHAGWRELQARPSLTCCARATHSRNCGSPMPAGSTTRCPRQRAAEHRPVAARKQAQGSRGATPRPSLRETRANATTPPPASLDLSGTYSPAEEQVAFSRAALSPACRTCSFMAPDRQSVESTALARSMPRHCLLSAAKSTGRRLSGSTSSSPKARCPGRYRVRPVPQA